MKIDYKFIQNESAAYYAYLKEFLKLEAPCDQIFDELRQMCAKTAFNEANRRPHNQALNCDTKTPCQDWHEDFKETGANYCMYCGKDFRAS